MLCQEEKNAKVMNVIAVFAVIFQWLEEALKNKYAQLDGRAGAFSEHSLPKESGVRPEVNLDSFYGFPETCHIFEHSFLLLTYKRNQVQSNKFLIEMTSSPFSTSYT